MSLTRHWWPTQSRLLGISPCYQQRRLGGLLDGDLDGIRLEMDTHYFGRLSVVRSFAPKIAGNGGAGLHVGYVDTDMTALVTAPKADPADIARIAVDGLEADLYEIVADDRSRQVLAGSPAESPPSIPSCRSF